MFIPGVPLPNIAGGADAGSLSAAYLAADETAVYYVAGNSVVFAAFKSGITGTISNEPADANLTALRSDGKYVYWTNTTSKLIRRAKINP